MLFDRANKNFFKKCALLSEEKMESCVRRFCLKSVILKDQWTGLSSERTRTVIFLNYSRYLQHAADSSSLNDKRKLKRFYILLILRQVFES